jgi:16S rRNA (adenine1518-N6/adenine1519-N6)-dimethyltransferase
LTVPLAARARQVVAFEIDRDLAGDLQASSPSNVTIVQADFLAVSTDDLRQRLAAHSADTSAIGSKRVAGNLPYNVASPILFKLVELFRSGLPLFDATVMLQREVADRLTATPATKEYGVLGILIGYHATVERMLALPPGAFRPVPAVRSAVVRLCFHPPEAPARHEPTFAAMVHAIFTRRRKTLTNALRAFGPTTPETTAKALMTANLDGNRRPETLTMSELVRLADAFA